MNEAGFMGQLWLALSYVPVTPTPQHPVTLVDINTGLLLKQLFNAVSAVSLLALVALGLFIVFGMMNVINMAHGEFFMLGAYAMWCFWSKASTSGSISPWPRLASGSSASSWNGPSCGGSTPGAI